MNTSREPGRRVVITGIGMVSPLGCSAEQLWAALGEGRSGLRAITHFDVAPFRTRLGGAIPDFNARQFIADPKSLKLMTRPVRIGVAAAELAVKSAQLNLEGVDPFRIACFVGSPGHAGDRDELLPALEVALRNGDPVDLRLFGAEGISTINPLWLLKSLANIVLYFVSLKLGAQGLNANICMSGAGGAIAIGEAFRAVRQGKADIAVAGGYESLLDEERLESFESSGLLYQGGNDGEGEAAGASRPFDRQRAGFVPAEGGTFLVMEEREAALARGARIYGEIRGFAAASSGVGPRPAETQQAFQAAMENALADARLDPWELDAIFAQACGARHADAVEAQAIKALLTARSSYVPVTAIKSFTGNLLAGSAPLEVVAGLGCVGGHIGLPPVKNLNQPDPDLGLAYVLEAQAARPLRHLLVNAASPVGNTASLVISQSV